MPLIDSRTGKVIRDYTIPDLEERAAYMRGLNETALCAAGSGHSGGTLSVMDICAALYLKVARHDPSNAVWKDRDRIIWSAGHKAPALYTSLAVAGFFPEGELCKLRMLGSPLQGHPHWRDLPGVEISSGSLGQGLSVAVGMALAAKLDNKAYRVFVISSDGEQQEGSIWEAAMSAAHHRLNNLILIIDKNRLQIDGHVCEVMNIDPLDEKYRAFGWEVLTINGHDISELVAALEKAGAGNSAGKPFVLICHTTKGKGVSFMEDRVEWHGKPPDKKQLSHLLKELGVNDKISSADILLKRQQLEKTLETSLDGGLPSFTRDYWWNRDSRMKVEMLPNRRGFGLALDRYGDDERIVCIGADISDSICISEFCRNHPDRKHRFISVGIAEQNGTAVAAGLAREGKIPVFGTYGVFASARNLDQLRVSVCYSNLNVLVVGAHGGVSVGPDGATHQELEAMFQIPGLPNMHMAVPGDAVETERMTRALLFDVVGPKYLRLARAETPVITRPDSPFRFGEATVFRFRKEASMFIDAFEVSLASEYGNEHEDIAIFSCGPETAEAMRAAFILKAEFALETRVLHLHTVKPLDVDAIVRAAEETNAILTVEEHQVGGFGNRVAGILATDARPNAKAKPFAMIGVPDRFGESGRPRQLIKHLGLSAEHIADRARRLLTN